MAWLLLGAGLLALALLAARAFTAADPRRLARALRWTGAGLLGLLALLCLVAGRLLLALPLAAAALLLLGRPLPFLGGLSGRAGGFPGPGSGAGGARAGGQVSEVETGWLRMRLDHDSGEIAGEVLQGRFAGRALDDLAPAELVELWRAIGTDDPQSARLVETYLDRHHGPDWRAAEAEPDAGESAQSGGGGGAQASMTRAEAYEVLGLSPGAGPEEIQDAYRRLMRNVHPDQGGSTWLAARINAARDVLLGPTRRN
jgi:hypothetical protein